MAFNYDRGISTTAGQLTDSKIAVISAPDFALTDTTPEEVKYTSINATSARPMTIGFGRKLVKDIYATSNIEAAYRCPGRNGVQIRGTSTFVGCLTNSDDPTFRQDFPISVSWSVKVPLNDYVTPEDVLAYLEAGVGTVFCNSTATADRIGQLMKGALTIQ